MLVHRTQLSGTRARQSTRYGEDKPRRSPGSLLGARVPPAANQLVLDAEMVADAAHDEIDQILDRSRGMVEAGHRGEDRRSRFGQSLHVGQLDARQRRFAGDENQLPPLLEMDVG